MRLERTVVKIGSSSLTDESGRPSATKMANLARQIVQMRRFANVQIVLVSSGAIACGCNQLGWLNRPVNLVEKQAAAAVGQGILMHMYEQVFIQEHVMIAQILLTKSDVESRGRVQRILRTIDMLLQHGVIPIVNENDTVAVDEIRFGDNDTLSSLVAVLIKAQRLIMLTDIDGLYTANPKLSRTATKIPDVWEITDAMEQAAAQSVSRVGTGGMQTKLRAAKRAVGAGIEVVIAESSAPNILMRILGGESCGTWIHAKQGHPLTQNDVLCRAEQSGTANGGDNGE